MRHRTTILLDAESRRTAKELAAKLDVSPSEVIRRALKAYQPMASRVTPELRKKRVQAARRLFRLFAGVDARAEILARRRENESGW